MKFLRTLHAKIFTIFFTTTILIILSILFFARSIDTARKSSILSVRKNLSVHLLSQIDKIGIPPRLDVAQSISRDLELRMSISGPGISWRSDAGFDPGSLLRAATDTRFKEVRLGRSGGHLFAISEKEGYQYIFEFQSSEMSFPYHLVLGLATIVIIILLISFVVTRWLMSPVKPLVKGVEELSNGNLNYRIRYHQNDEFGAFVNLFNKMAEQIQQMLKAKDKLLLDVSHEIRSPLGRMKLASEMLDEGTLRASLQEDIHEMEFMVDEILERYRLNTPQGGLKLERINLTALLEELTALYKTSGVGVLFRNTIFGEAWVMGDLIRLKKALTNLIENGLKYSGQAFSPVEIGLSADESHYVIEILDHGVGINESELKLIFEPFYKADHSRDQKAGGYGLGLSICQDIITAHHGRVSVSSRENIFTQFTVILPKE